MSCPVALREGFHSYVQEKNQNRTKHAKIFGSLMSGYNVKHVGCWKKEPFESIGTLNIIVIRHVGYLTCEYFFVQQFNSQTNVVQMVSWANGKPYNWNRPDSHYSLSSDLLILICSRVSHKHICLCFHTCFLSIKPLLYRLTSHDNEIHIKLKSFMVCLK